MKGLDTIPFTLSFLYITLTLRNHDSSVPNVNEIDSNNIYFYETLSLLSLVNFFQSNAILISAIIINILFSVFLQLVGNELVIKIFNILFLLLAVVVFLSSTILFNSTDKKDCKFTQMSFRRKYTEGEKQEEEEDKEIIKLNTFDTSFGYTILYALGLALLMITYLKDKSISKMSIIYIFLYFVLGLVFQLLTSFILRFFHNQKTWPSVFSYLDQFIINADKNQSAYRIIGLIRLLLVFICCLFIAFSFSLKKGISVKNVMIMISLFYLLFTVFLVSWQTVLGDGCIMDRTMEQYKGGEKRSGLIDININIFSEQWGKPFKSILYCSMGNQLGIYFHLVLVAIIAMFL